MSLADSTHVDLPLSLSVGDLTTSLVANTPLIYDFIFHIFGFMNQEVTLAILKSGRNTFITGSAGAGKTYVLNQYIQYLKDRQVPVAVTASTGIAATHMNGMTIHSWSGIGVKDELSGKDLQHMKSRKYLLKNLENVKVLIIDEISMLHRKQLDLVNIVLQYFKKNDKPFGGVQVLFSGDFFQLPPVGKREESSRDKFAFMSKAWVEADLAVCYIMEQHRQEDNELNGILNEIRDGDVSEWSLEKLGHTAKRKLAYDQPTRLYTHNVDVDRMNAEQLDLLKAPAKTYTASTSGNPVLLETLKKSVLTEELLQLKIGSKVMFVKNNYEKGYMNGTLGEVTGYSDEGFPVVKTFNEEEIEAQPEQWYIENEKGSTLASFTQVPLRLAWAITVHKSQGMTLDAAEIDLSKTFERGQGYVALSRLRDMDGLKLSGFNPMALQVDALVQRADQRFRALSREAEFNSDLAVLKKVADDFVRECGGITDPSEIERLKKKKKEKKQDKKSTYLITKECIEKGLSIKEIALERGLTEGTIMGHILKVRELYPDTDISGYRPPEKEMQRIQKAYKGLISENDPENFYNEGDPRMSALFKALEGKMSYADIKLAMAFLEQKEMYHDRNIHS